MNKSVLMIMGGALVVAIVVAMLVQMKLSPKKNTASTATEILVATKTLSPGKTIEATDVRWQVWPETSVFKGMIKRKDQADEKKLEIFGKPVRREIQSGEPITTQAVIADAKSGGSALSALIGDGMRAVAVSTKAESMVGGFISPGSYVDVILTYQLSLKGDAENYSDGTIQKYASETVLSNIRVLAVDQNSKEEAASAKVGRTVTLEVSKAGAQVLSLASTMGDITLALRRLGEKDTAADGAAPITTDVNTSQVIQRIYQNMDKSKTSSDTVRLYNGSTVTNVPVRTAPHTTINP